MFAFKNQALFGAAVLVAAFTMQSASAGGPVHRMPADYHQTQRAYQLKLVASDVARPLVLTLLGANGQPVTDGEVAMVHPVNRGIKASPMIQYVPEVLARDANGNFVCMGKHHRGEVVAFRGVGRAGASPVWLTVTING
jgi:glucose/arabinose dehydrogenase